MEKKYTDIIAALRSTTIDANNIDSQSINIYPGKGDIANRQNILDIIAENGGLNHIQEEMVEGLTDYYTSYNTLTFSEGFERVDDSSTNGPTSCIKFSHWHCPKGIIKEVYLSPTQNYRGGSNTTAERESYLIAYIKKNSDHSVVRSYRSINKILTVSRHDSNGNEITLDVNHNTWYFDGIITPDKDEYIFFKPSLSGDVNDTSLNFYFHFQHELNHTHKNCGYGGDNQGNYNPGNVVMRFDGIFYTQNVVRKHVDNTNIHIKNYEKSIIEQLYTKESTLLYDNISCANPDNDGNLTGVASIRAFVLSKSTFKNGIINRLGLPHGSFSETFPEIYLILTIFDRNYKEIKSLISKNSILFSQPQNNDTEKEEIFIFDEFEINDNVGFLRVEPSTNGLTPDLEAKMRVMTLNNVEETDDEDGGETSSGPSSSHNFNIRVKFYEPFAKLSVNADYNNGLIDLSGHLTQNCDLSDYYGSISKVLRESINPLKVVSNGNKFTQCNIIPGDDIINMHMLKYTEHAIIENLTASGDVNIDVRNLEICNGLISGTISADIINLECPNLVKGNNIISGSSVDITGIRVSLPNLLDGRNIFSNVQLDDDSFKFIALSLQDISTYDSAALATRFGLENFGQITLYAKNSSSESVKSYIRDIKSKGWSYSGNVLV